MTTRLRLRRCSTTGSLTIIEAMLDPNLFGETFRDIASWSAWRVFLGALFGLGLSEDQLRIYAECTKREKPPDGGVREAWLVCGRRAGKSFILALIAVFLACFIDWRKYLGPGERGTVMIIAADRKQARTILRFILGLLEQSPMLAQLIEAQTRESVTLRNRINIEIHTASFRSTRGYTIVAALLDELAFWPAEDSAQPDEEVIAAIRPGMATVPGAMLLCASSPHARRGALWQAYKNYFGKADSPVLVWQAPTRVMNPNVPQAWIDAEIERDPGKNTAEYLAQFRTDLEAYVRREAVEACITPKILVRLPQPGVVYHGFVDPSGGSADEMTLAIAHYDRARQMVVIDALHWFTPPFSPVTVVSESARILKTYRVHKIVGDRYAGEWPREQFAKFGIRYEPSTKSKSELYVDLLPLINSARIELLDQPRAINQLLALERRTARGGRESIDHPAGGHDDLINAIAGAAVSAVSRYASFDTSLAWVSGPDDNTAPERSYAAQRLSAYIRAHERFF